MKKYYLDDGRQVTLHKDLNGEGYLVKDQISNGLPFWVSCILEQPVLEALNKEKSELLSEIHELKRQKNILAQESVNSFEKLKNKIDRDERISDYLKKELEYLILFKLNRIKYVILFSTYSIPLLKEVKTGRYNGRVVSLNSISLSQQQNVVIKKDIYFRLDLGYTKNVNSLLFTTKEEAEKKYKEILKEYISTKTSYSDLLVALAKEYKIKLNKIYLERYNKQEKDKLNEKKERMLKNIKEYEYKIDSLKRELNK